MAIDAQVPDVLTTLSDEKQYFRISKKKRNAPNALNKKRKNLSLYEDITGFDYKLITSIEEKDDEEFEKNKREQKPWQKLAGRVSSMFIIIDYIE